jgi:CBS domain-containing protein
MVNTAEDFECDVVTVAPSTSCVDVADDMDLNSVGCVVIVEDGAPVGIVTDRDLVCRVTALNLDPESTLVSEIMSTNVVTAESKDDIVPLLEAMRSRNIRRVPIVSDGRLTGLVSLDDLLVQLGSYVFNANRGILGGLQESHRTTRNRRRGEAREEAFDEIRRQLTDFSEETRRIAHDRINELLELVGRRN